MSRYRQLFLCLLKKFDAVKVDIICVSDSDCHAVDNFPMSYCLKEERVPFDS